MPLIRGFLERWAWLLPCCAKKGVKTAVMQVNRATHYCTFKRSGNVDEGGHWSRWLIPLITVEEKVRCVKWRESVPRKGQISELWPMNGYIALWIDRFFPFLHGYWWDMTRNGVNIHSDLNMQCISLFGSTEAKPSSASWNEKSAPETRRCDRRHCIPACTSSAAKFQFVVPNKLLKRCFRYIDMVSVTSGTVGG